MNRTSWLTILSVPAVLFATASAAGAGPAGEYAITLHRPAEVGQRFHVRAEGLSQRSMTPVRDGASQQSQDTHVAITFDAEAEIAQVDANGRPVRVVFTVEDCTAKVDSRESVIATPGSTITASRPPDGG
jgi:hypothetical protein